MKKESVVERILAKVVGTEMSVQEQERVAGGMKWVCAEWSQQPPQMTEVCDRWDPA